MTNYPLEIIDYVLAMVELSTEQIPYSPLDITQGVEVTETACWCVAANNE